MDRRIFTPIPLALALACAGSGKGNSGSVLETASDTAGTEGTGGTTGSSSSTGGSSAGSESTSTTSGSTTTTGTTRSGSSTGLMCDDDINESNEDESNATDLGAFNDDDDNGGSVQGVLAGQNDVDWFRWHGDDDAFNVADPTRDIAASDGLRICKFIECDNGLTNTEVTCEGGTTPGASPDGRPGCCHTGGFDISNFNCAGSTEDSITTFVRIDQAANDACISYTLSYHF